MADRKQDVGADRGNRSEEQIDRREEIAAAPPRGGGEAAGAFGNAAHDNNIKRGPAGTGQGGGGGAAEIELDQLVGAIDVRPETAEASDAPPGPTDEVKSGRLSDPDLTGRSDGHKTEEEMRRSGKQP